MSTDFTKYNVPNDTNDGAPRPTRSRGDLAALADGNAKHILRFGFDNNQYGEYSYFVVSEDAEHIYYGGKQITEALKQIDADGAADELAAVPVYFEAGHFTTHDGRNINFYHLNFKPAAVSSADDTLPF